MITLYFSRRVTACAIFAFTFVFSCVTPVRAEGFLDVELLDMWRAEGQAAAMLAIMETDLNESDNLHNAIQMGQCPLPNTEDMNRNGPCYAFDLTDSHLQISDIQSNVLARLGNTDYVLLRWKTQGKLTSSFIFIRTGFNGVYNGNGDAQRDMSRLPGVMTPDAPLQFIHERYDDQLNLLYRKTMNALDATKPEYAKDLRASQRQWLKNANAQCDSMTDPESHANCLLPLTAKRVWEIKRMRIDWGLAQKMY